MGETLRTALDWFDADAPHPGTSQTSTATVKGVDQDATPLVSEDTRPLAPPLDDLGPLEPVVRNLQARTKAPMAIALQSVLGVVCLAAQGHRDVETLGGAVPLSLFLITIAQSGERKSTCDKLSLKAVREFEERQADGYRLALPDHHRRRELFEARKARVLKEVKSANTAEQVAALEHLGSPPEPPVLPDLVLSNVTLEGLQRHLIEGPPSVGVFTDEGGGFFGGHGFSSENRTKTVSGFSELWDATPVKRGRAGDGMTVLRNRRVCLHVMVQGRIASKALSDEIVRDQGFFSRTLICWPESTIGHRFIDVAESPLSQGALEEFHERITGLLERPLPTRDTNPHELAPETLRLDPEARELLVEFFNHVEHAQRDDGPFAAIRGFASKACENAARLAGTLTLYNDQDAISVTAETMVAAIALMNWYLSEFKRLFDVTPLAAETEEAQCLLDWLQTGWSERAVTIRAIVRFGPRRLRDSKKARQLVKRLVTDEWLVALPSGAKVEGKPSREAWQVVRP